MSLGAKPLKNSLLIALLIALGISPVRANNQTHSTPQSSNISQRLQSKLNSGDAQRGQLLFKGCVTCHSLQKGGAARLGPVLLDIVNAPVAADEAYRYSLAMKKLAGSGAVWTEQLLFDFLKSPQSVIPGTRMAYRGMVDEQDRANIILYLKKISANKEASKSKK